MWLPLSRPVQMFESESHVDSRLITGPGSKLRRVGKRSKDGFQKRLLGGPVTQGRTPDASAEAVGPLQDYGGARNMHHFKNNIQRQLESFYLNNQLVGLGRAGGS
jgi:hypothetical protein